MFATPIAGFIDEAGIIVHNAAVGEDAILNLLPEALASATAAARKYSPR
jgi:hypothetical protein